MKAHYSISAFLLCMAVSTASVGATRTVCGYVNFWDKRSNCSGCGTSCEPGRIDPCTPDTKKSARGLVVELWDYDSDGGDEYIGAWKWDNGYRCMTFEWENAAYSKGETNPDIYMKISGWKLRTGTAEYVYLRNPDWTTPADMTWRTTNRVNECTGGAPCVFPSEHIIGTNSRSDSWTILMNMGNSIENPYLVFANYLVKELRVRWAPHCIDCGDPSQGPDDCACGSATAGFADRDQIRVVDSSVWPWYVAAHEFGHVTQLALLGRTSLRCDYGPDGDHSLTGVNPDSGATAEGWAHYVACRGYWDPENSSSVPYIFGFDFESATPVNHDPGDTCADNRGVELQIGKSFWDLDDAASETYVAPAQTGDGINASTSDIAECWYEFADGTSNRQDFECDGDCDTSDGSWDPQHGVNAWDYYYNCSHIFAASFYSSFLWHNCQQTMDSN